jgi:predicted  nucleic acid-binding Zn-ribbon protein
MFAKDPEKPLQDRLAEIEAQEKTLRTELDAKQKSWAAERASLHTKITVIRQQKLESARVKMAARLAPIEAQIVKLREKQQELQKQRNYAAADALVAQVANLYEQRREAIAAA